MAAVKAEETVRKTTKVREVETVKATETVTEALNQNPYEIRRIIIALS